MPCFALRTAPLCQPQKFLRAAPWKFVRAAPLVLPICAGKSACCIFLSFFSCVRGLLRKLYFLPCFFRAFAGCSASCILTMFFSCIRGLLRLLCVMPCQFASAWLTDKKRSGKENAARVKGFVCLFVERVGGSLKRSFLKLVECQAFASSKWALDAELPAGSRVRAM